MDLLKIIQKLPGCPPFFTEELLDRFGKKVVVTQDSSSSVFPTPAFAAAKRSSSRIHGGRSLPQAIAHRGHKVTYPENTLAAFEAAVEAGAQGLETDVHLTKDGVVVLSHDSDLKRCFGVERRLRDCEWSYVQTLRTTKTPSQPMPRLEDLLRCLLRPEWEGIWLLLDIKIDDDPEEMMHRIAETLERVRPEDQANSNFAWKDRLVLGIWTATYIPLIARLFPGYSLVNIGFSPTYAHQFLTLPYIGFNFLHLAALSPAGRSLMREARARGSRLWYSWTVNDEKNMEWCIRRGVDGVITDDIPKFVETCRRFEEEEREGGRGEWYQWWSWQMLRGLVLFNFWVFLWSFVFRRRYGKSVISTEGGEADKDK